MSHVERVTSRDYGQHLDIERCPCGKESCTVVTIGLHAFDRQDIEHALKALFGEVSPGTRYFDRQFHGASS